MGKTTYIEKTVNGQVKVLACELGKACEKKLCDECPHLKQTGSYKPRPLSELLEGM